MPGQLTGHTDWVTQVEFIDADTVVSSSDDGTTRAWDVATGTQKAEFEGDKFSFTKSRDHAVAFFRAPGVVQTLECAGDRIAVGCQNGEVLHLQAPWLVDSDS